MKQVISVPTHILQNFSSCIDFIFVNQSNIVIDSGIHPARHLNFHHQFIFHKFNLKIGYMPPYACEIWDYGKAQTDLINREINQFVRDKLFLDKTLMNK